VIFQKTQRIFSAVINEGGHIVWLAGEGGNKDARAKIFWRYRGADYIDIRQPGKTLKLAGGSVDDIVNMTVFIKNVEDGKQIRSDAEGLLPKGNYPASSLITIKDLAQPGWVIEVEAIAVIGDEQK